MTESGTRAASTGQRRRARRRRRIITGALICLLIVAVGAIGVLASQTSRHAGDPRSSSTAEDMNGNPVTLDPGVTAAPDASARAIPDTGARLVISSVGLDVPLGALNAVAGQITPPGFTSAYWVRNMGVSVSHSGLGTVYVVMHSLRHGGKAPGNYLLDVATGTSSVRAGATVRVADVSYTVTGSETVTKTELAHDAAIWTDTPDRLVLITCLQRPDGSPSVDNMIITAERA